MFFGQLGSSKSQLGQIELGLVWWDVAAEDAVSTSDTKSVTCYLSKSDSATDADKSLCASFFSKSDALSVSDTSLVTASKYVATSDAISVSDSRLLNIYLSEQDSSSVVDNSQRYLLSYSRFDPISTAELSSTASFLSNSNAVVCSESPSAVFYKSAQDTLSVSDAVGTVKLSQIDISENVAVSEVRSIGVYKSKSDSIVVNDNVRVFVDYSTSNSISILDQEASTEFDEFREAIALVDARRIATYKNSQESVTLATDRLSRTLYKLFSNSITTSDIAAVISNPHIDDPTTVILASNGTTGVDVETGFTVANSDLSITNSDVAPTITGVAA